jgi:DNA-binding transcriptional LysR family regulator
MTDPALRSDWLAAFVAFAERRSFTHAARALHLSQPALHVQIAKLSEEVGVRLYVRQGRGLELTREGVQLLAFAREAEERSRELVAVLRGEATEAETRVGLAAGEGAYRYLLGDALRLFTRRSSARLDVLTRDRDGTVEAVRSGEAHLGVGSFATVPDELVATTLLEVGQSLVVPSSHLLARKRSVRLADLADASLVVPPLGRPHRTALAQALDGARVSWRVAAEATGWDLMLHFASLGIGLAVVNDFCRLPRGLVARPLRGLPSVRYSLLFRRTAHLGPSAQVLRQCILERATSPSFRSPPSDPRGSRTGGASRRSPSRT